MRNGSRSEFELNLGLAAAGVSAGLSKRGAAYDVSIFGRQNRQRRSSGSRKATRLDGSTNVSTTTLRPPLHIVRARVTCQLPCSFSIITIFLSSRLLVDSLRYFEVAEACTAPIRYDSTLTINISLALIDALNRPQRFSTIKSYDTCSLCWLDSRRLQARVRPNHRDGHGASRVCLTFCGF